MDELEDASAGPDEMDKFLFGDHSTKMMFNHETKTLEERSGSYGATYGAWSNGLRCSAEFRGSVHYPDYVPDWPIVVSRFKSRHKLDSMHRVPMTQEDAEELHPDEEYTPASSQIMMGWIWDWNVYTEENRRAAQLYVSTIPREIQALLEPFGCAQWLIGQIVQDAEPQLLDQVRSFAQEPARLIALMGGDKIRWKPFEERRGVMGEVLSGKIQDPYLEKLAGRFHAECPSFRHADQLIELANWGCIYDQATEKDELGEGDLFDIFYSSGELWRSRHGSDENQC